MAHESSPDLSFLSPHLTTLSKALNLGRCGQYSGAPFLPSYHSRAMVSFQDGKETNLSLPVQHHAVVLQRLTPWWVQLRERGSLPHSPPHRAEALVHVWQTENIGTGPWPPHSISFIGQRFHSGTGKLRRPKKADPTQHGAHTVTKHWAYIYLFQCKAQGVEREVCMEISGICMGTVISMLRK